MVAKLIAVVIMGYFKTFGVDKYSKNRLQKTDEKLRLPYTPFGSVSHEIKNRHDLDTKQTTSFSRNINHSAPFDIFF